MDHERFDLLAQGLAAGITRRSALAALLGSGLAGAAVLADAKNRSNLKKRRAKQRKAKRQKQARANRDAAPAEVTAQAVDCTSLASGSNLNGCNFSGDDLAGVDLHGSSLRGTIFAGADLSEANLSSSTLIGASFVDADLCGANLASSQLRTADFRGADLANARLQSSSGCNTVVTNNATTFCNTRWCDGKVRNPGCVKSCCKPKCDGKACGANDGCGGRCQTGPCPGDEVCDAGQCRPPKAGTFFRCSCAGGASGDVCTQETCGDVGGAIRVCVPFCQARGQALGPTSCGGRACTF